MNMEASTKTSAGVEQHVQQPSAISNQLRAKLRRFLMRDKLFVKTRQGEIIGEVKDLIPRSNLDEHFNLIVSRNVSNQLSDQISRLYVLNSKYITKIDPANRAILTTFENLDTVQLPDYQNWNTMDNRLVDPILDPALADNQTADNTADNTLVAKQASDDDMHLQTVSEQHSIQLLEERLQVGRTRRKVGEIIVRKQIETRLVEVPVRREKLIVEQVGGSDKPLAEIDLGIGEVVGVDLTTKDALSGAVVVRGTFSSLMTVAQLLDVVEKTIHYKARKVVVYLYLGNGELQETYHEFATPGIAATVVGAIANSLPSSCRNIRVEVALENEDARPIYQKWFDYYSNL